MISSVRQFHILIVEMICVRLKIELYESNLLSIRLLCIHAAACDHDNARADHENRTNNVEDCSTDATGGRKFRSLVVSNLDLIDSFFASSISNQLNSFCSAYSKLKCCSSRGIPGCRCIPINNDCNYIINRLKLWCVQNAERYQKAYGAHGGIDTA